MSYILAKSSVLVKSLIIIVLPFNLNAKIAILLLDISSYFGITEYLLKVLCVYNPKHIL